MAEAIRSLTHLLEVASSRRFLAVVEPGDRGLAESLPFPFIAMVGEWEMKLALLLAVVNPAIGGVLLLGPRGTGKTTAVRSLSPLLPDVQRSLCAYGCMPEDVESGGIESICPDCAKKLGLGEPLTFTDRARLIELPLHSELPDVIGGIDERAAAHQRMLVKPGILSHADRNLLYVDEVNLLVRDVADAILDAAAQGVYTVRRGPISATYRSRFVLVGSMNPEEGMLRPQIADRFGLRALVRGLNNSSERWEAYQRSHAFELNPRGFHRILPGDDRFDPPGNPYRAKAAAIGAARSGNHAPRAGSDPKAGGDFPAGDERIVRIRPRLRRGGRPRPGRSFRPRRRCCAGPADAAFRFHGPLRLRPGSGR